MKGYVQVYTGDGKGKTTAAIGLAIRAVGAGLKVFIGQFVKGMYYSELNALQRFYPKIVVKQYGRGCFIEREPSSEDISAARKGFDEIKEVIMSGEYDVIILDEANIAVHFGLIPETDFVRLIDERPEGVELVFTGRRAPREILERADLISEIKEVRHYYQRGVQAREGIEK
ncbi:MAG: cob(I)yrinic acid a,c-diamide adenosyltransferase [Bacillota bacterium]|jgi:cob(I)alamin adenosyltransferase|nr:cob(I)yrinic acid a,c-diamide adenosyltransferase [Bacillota bacterium]MDD3297527.1 cob(I)yrinic acid a,c-diamide adenosyltransferase [Bacillota bacterium]MDD3850225.1 cob(I)yrinic acid a,c-diamide adenosyltransferase [Bacillota bacterium]MDD4707232.1 cob(I)yrinic acid a,c-diamide adenosyltransferase [Bacillota bacterium]